MDTLAMNVERDKYRGYRLYTNGQCDDCVCHIVLSITVEEMKSNISLNVVDRSFMMLSNFRKDLQILVRENCNTNRSIGK